ncbi:MAG: hypothetical protein M3R46_05635, partial [Actinomycetota bacterium]|nr:hypothetical protein [Actinomycetota bacterium]
MGAGIAQLCVEAGVE